MMSKIVCLRILCLSAAVCAADWPQFRGPNSSAVSTANNLPSEWGAEKNIHWKVEVPGFGWSSPIVWGERLFLTTAVSEGPVEKPKPRMAVRPQDLSLQDTVYRWEVHCLDKKTGRTVWKQVAARHKPASPIHIKNSYATETPLTDGERVYAYFGSAGLYSFDLAGNPLWNKQLGTPKMRNGWGTGSSPALAGDRLFVQCDNEERSFLAAFDRKTGDELWRVDREPTSSWATPFVWRNQKRTELVAMGDTVRSYDPATGKQLWELRGMASTVVASPVATEDMLFLGSASLPSETDLPLYAIRAGAAGDVTPDQGKGAKEPIAWLRSKSGPSMASPLVYGGYVYVVHEGGFFQCLDAKTGHEVYPKQRLQRSRRGLTASPWAYDGKVFVLSEEGTTYVIQAGAEFKLLGTNTLDDMFLASAAVGDGALYIRGRDHLYCVREASPAAVPP